jgi:hypothetical protein
LLKTLPEKERQISVLVGEKDIISIISNSDSVLNVVKNFFIDFPGNAYHKGLELNNQKRLQAI